MTKMMMDLKYAIRLLAKSPGFTATSLLVVVLGMALYICSYSLQYNFSDKPLSYSNGDRFVGVRTIFEKTGVDTFGENFDAYAIRIQQESTRSYAHLGAYRYQPLTVSDGDYAERVVGAEIMPETLATTGEQAHLGRGLLPEDASPGARPVALLGYKLWQNYYAADPNIIGSTTRVNGELYTVVGVMPQGFDYPASQQLWLPLSISAAAEPSNIQELAAIGVLKDGVDLETASAEMDALVQQLAEDHPQFYGHHGGARVVRHSAAVVPSSGAGGLLGLLSLVILGLVTINLAALLFVRAHTRQKELAVRTALGASRAQIAGQVLRESLILCLAGLLLSLLVADFVLHLVETKIVQSASQSDYPGDLMSWVNLGVDLRAFAVALAVTLGLWLLSGCWAAYRASSNDANAVLASGGKGSSQQSNSMTMRLVVGTEVVVSCFLLMICCLLAVSIFNMYRLDYGTATGGYLTGILELKDSKYADERSRRQLLNDLQAELSDSSSVQDATVTSALPGQFGARARFSIEDRDLREDRQYPSLPTVSIASNYFANLAVPLRQGRFFAPTDTENSRPVAIVGERLAEQLWAGESAVGKRLLINPDTEGREWLTIIGVAGHIVQGNPFGGYDRTPTLYRPIAQHTPLVFSVAIQLNPGVETEQAERHLRDTLKRLDRDLALVSVRTLETVIEMSLAGMDLIAQVVSAYALATLVFAVIGIYGLIVRSVALRTGEIGIRKALGSSREKVLWLFLRQGLVYLAIGTLVGTIGALLASKLLTTYFQNILLYLPAVLGAVTAVIGALVLLACYLPARKAAWLEPGRRLEI